MYSYNDFERLFLRYKLEGLPSGVSIEKFCMFHKVPYSLFEKRYKDTRMIILVQVFGALNRSRNDGKAFNQSRNAIRKWILGFLLLPNFESWWISA